MAQVYRTYHLDSELIGRGIKEGVVEDTEIRGKINRTVETLISRGYEAAKGPNDERGIPSEILVGGRNSSAVQQGFRKAVQENGLSDYILNSGKEYTR